MTPETLSRYCFAAVIGTGFGLIVVLVLLAIIAITEGLAIRDTWEALSRDQTRDQK